MRRTSNKQSSEAFIQCLVIGVFDSLLLWEA